MVTTKQSLYERIKQDIVDEQLPLNTGLKQEALSLRYGVSRIPVRDTLLRLKSDGWLVPHGKRGVKIAPLNAEEAEDLYKLRVLIEPMILEHVIEKITLQDIGKARDILAYIEKNTGFSSQEVGELNWQFHACLYACAKRDTLFSSIENLHFKCSRYIGFHNRELDYMHISEQEHHELIAGIEAKNLLLSQTILQQHIQNAGEKLVSHLKSR